MHISRRLLPLLLTLPGFSSFAQQALWGNAQVVSPQVNADHTVTFRLRIYLTQFLPLLFR